MSEKQEKIEKEELLNLLGSMWNTYCYMMATPGPDGEKRLNRIKSILSAIPDAATLDGLIEALGVFYQQWFYAKADKDYKMDYFKKYNAQYPKLYKFLKAMREKP